VMISDGSFTMAIEWSTVRTPLNKMNGPTDTSVYP
jgi:hypothetical protein